MDAFTTRGAMLLRPDTRHAPQLPLVKSYVRPIDRRLLPKKRRHLFVDPKLPLPLCRPIRSGPLHETHPQAATRRQLQRSTEIGRSVDTLRGVFPSLLLRPWPEELLSEDIVFQDGISPHFGLQPLNAYGKGNYNRHMWLLRLSAHLTCKQTKVEVVRFWQPCRECVLVRWSIKLRPRVLYNFNGVTLQIDGVSELKLDRCGRIFQHVVDISDRHRIKFDLNFQPFARTAPQKMTSLVG